MARKRSRSTKKRSTLFSRLTAVIWIVVTGGSIAGWAVPDLPVVGPLVQRVVRSVVARHAPATDGERPGGLEELRDRVSGSSHAAPALIPVTDGAQSSDHPSAPSRKPAETITIASFNIQVFGESKLSKTWVVEILAQIVRQFDVVAIQEVRSKSDEIIPRFVQAVNADGSRYNYVIGPRLGRSVSTEQYAFVYDTNRIEIDMSSSGTIQDPNDQMHREPFVTRFRARTPNPQSSFTFWLVNAHTDPDEVPTEVDALADVFLVMQQARAEEDDVILLGDLNADDRQFGRLGQIPGITWVVHGTTTNTRQSKMYDNMLFDRSRTAEYTGRWGVYDLETNFNLSREEALKVSDHLPIWAEFQIHEAGTGSTARLPLGGMRR